MVKLLYIHNRLIIDLKESWKLIGSIIKRKAKGHSNSHVARIIRNNKVCTNELEIANQLNQLFTTFGPTLVGSIVATDEDPTKYIHNSPQNSFYLSTVTEKYIAQLFSSLEEKKASLDIPNKLIKIGSHELSFTYYLQSINYTVYCPQSLRTNPNIQVC